MSSSQQGVQSLEELVIEESLDASARLLNDAEDDVGPESVVTGLPAWLSTPWGRGLA